MYCTHCGKQNPDEAAYCWGCGAELTQSHPDVGESGPTVAEELPAPGEAFTPGTLIDGRYRIERLLGQGGMGRVWAARDVRLDLLVAIKFIGPALWENPAARQRFLGEARLCLGLTHPGIVRLHTLGEWLGQTYLVLEYLEGQTLAERLAELKRAGRRPDWPEAAAILDQLAEAVGTAHRASVIHRDLKPSNIMLARREGGAARLVVLDFGLAKALGSEGPTRLGAALGTPFYMAPEQTRDGSQVDQRADIYAIGAIAYELLSGKVPLGRLAAIRQTYPAVPAEVEAWIFGALEPEPEARKVRLEELRQLLRKATPGLKESAEEEKQTPPPAPEKKDAGAGKTAEAKTPPQDAKKTPPKTAAQTAAAAKTATGAATGQTVTAKPVATGTSRGHPFLKTLGYMLLISAIVYGKCQQAKQQAHNMVPSFKPIPTPAPFKWHLPSGQTNPWDGNPGLVRPKPDSLSPALKKMLPTSPRPSTSLLFEGDRAYEQGQKYMLGEGIAKNDAQAAAWFRKAAEAGNSKGMNGLGYMYQNGRGVPENESTAFTWYQKAAEAGNADGMNNLGWLYGNGKRVARNPALAFRWYLKAAEAGSPAGMYNAGLMYETGQGVAQNIALALMWYERAAAQGRSDALDKVRRLSRKSR